MYKTILFCCYMFLGTYRGETCLLVLQHWNSFISVEASPGTPVFIFTNNGFNAALAQVTPPITCYEGQGPFQENFTTCETEGRCVKLTSLTDR